MPDRSLDAAAGACALLALLGRPMEAAERDHLLAALEQIRGDARVLAALDLEGIEPEARPLVDPVCEGEGQ